MHETAFPLLRSLFAAAQADRHDDDDQSHSGDRLTSVLGGLSLSQLALHAGECLHYRRIARAPKLQFAATRLLDFVFATLVYLSIADRCVRLARLQDSGYRGCKTP